MSEEVRFGNLTPSEAAKRKHQLDKDRKLDGVTPEQVLEEYLPGVDLSEVPPSMRLLAWQTVQARGSALVKVLDKLEEQARGFLRDREKVARKSLAPAIPSHETGDDDLDDYDDYLASLGDDDD